MKQKTMDSPFSFDFLHFSKNSWTAVKTKKIQTEIDDKILSVHLTITSYFSFALSDPTLLTSWEKISIKPQDYTYYIL